MLPLSVWHLEDKRLEGPVWPFSEAAYPGLEKRPFWIISVFANVTAFTSHAAPFPEKNEQNVK